MHQCTIDLAASSNITRIKSNNANDRATGGEIVPWDRIDLDVASSPGGAGPVIKAFAINTKGTGTSSGRASSDHATNTKGTGTSGRAAGVDMAINTKGMRTSSQAGGEARNGPVIDSDCDDRVVKGDAAWTATAADFAFLEAGGKGVGWSCSVSGSEDRPQFVVRLLVPPILGQAERKAAAGASRTEWSWGKSNHRVSIVPRSADYAGSWHIACSSTSPRYTNYDLAVLKK